MLVYQGFAQAAETVYTQAADSKDALRETIIAVASQNAKSLYLDDHGTEFRRVSRTTPALSYDIITGLATMNAKPEKVEVGEQCACPDCISGQH